MGAKRVTTMAEIRAKMEKATQKLHSEVVRTLARLGEECVIKAKDRPQTESWFDQTGNLRSSIGYLILRGGQIVRMGGFSGQGAGVEQGRKFAEQIARKYPTDYVLVIVAGMKYAVHVEAMEGKDVLATPTLYARKRLPELMEQLEIALRANDGEDD